MTSFSWMAPTISQWIRSVTSSRSGCSSVQKYLESDTAGDPDLLVVRARRPNELKILPLVTLPPLNDSPEPTHSRKDSEHDTFFCLLANLRS